MLNHRRPLKLNIDTSQPVRLNILFPFVDLNDYISNDESSSMNIIHFSLNSILSGVNIRLLNLHGCDVTHDHLRVYSNSDDDEKHLKEQMITPNSLADSIATNPNDMFIGVNYETAIRASATQKLLNKNPNIIYFIPDFEGSIFSAWCQICRGHSKL